MRHCIHGLTALKNDILPASAISRALPDGIFKDLENPWSGMLGELLDAYAQETGDAQLPVHYFVDWLYEALAELRREKALGQGLFLNTVHGAKGLEFEHVFILDGDWQITANAFQQEERTPSAVRGHDPGQRDPVPAEDECGGHHAAHG